MRDTIFLQYYSRMNFGDDLLVRVLAQQFPDRRICLLGNPTHIPKNLGPNIRISPYSWIIVAVGVLQARMKSQRSQQRLQRLYDQCVGLARAKSKASVMVGGSIFMDSKNGREEVRFDADEHLERDFSLRSSLLPGRNHFVIGANLGPAFSQEYFSNMERRTGTYAHVCFRDYASYSKLSSCPNVQYAPDVVFAMDPIRRNPQNKKVVISVINLSKHTGDHQVIESYYTLLAQTISHLSQTGHRIVLASFCKREGDETGISRLLEYCKSSESIEIYRYTGDMDGMINCFAGASFVIASRFHSMILAAVCGKPMFPIAYNCKTTHYLQDLRFSGSYGTLDTLSGLTVSDVLRNYEDGYICDCAAHHQYAKNQFWALKRYLEGES